MEIFEYLKRSTLQLPITFKGSNYIEETQRFFASFQNDIKLTNDLDEQYRLTAGDLQKVRTLQENLVGVIQHFFNGDSYRAYGLLRETMKTVEGELGNFSFVQKPGSWKFFDKLFRVRTATETLKSRADIFHVPFSKRRQVQSYRFSVPGLPALYFGSSMYICWEEMGRPSLEDLYAAKFRLSETETISSLNLSMTPLMLSELFKEIPVDSPDADLKSAFAKAFKSMLILWPLIASCHVSVLRPELYFKPEYIIPQLVMQFVSSENDFESIVYYSTKVNAQRIHPSRCLNFVFPAKNNITSLEFAPSLSVKVQCTEPLSIRLFLASISAGFGTAVPPDFAVAEGVDVNYSVTDFGRIESALAKMSFASV